MKRNRRLNIMTISYMVLFLVLFLVIMGRFLFIQVTGTVHDVSLTELAEQRRTVSYSLPAERGKIYDRNGMVLAYDRPAFKLYAIVDEDYTLNSRNPKHVVDIDKTAEQLAKVLDADEEYFRERLQIGKENNRFQVEFGSVGKNLSQTIKEEIDALELPGINFEPEPIRYYPNGVFASHIIGLAQRDQNSDEEDAKIVGLTGIEREMNDLLMGKDGYISYERDGYLKKLLYPNETVIQPKNGVDIFLTLDQKVQTLLEDILSQVEEDYEPERIVAIIANAKSGEIVAMGSRPSFDLNNPVDVKNWYNDAISSPFEPGSTVKAFTWAAAIDAGVYNENETYKSGRYQINPIVEPVHDVNDRGWGEITFDEGFIRSSNVAAAKLVWEKIGPDEYLEYLKKFDFDKKTNIDLPNEVAGQILYNWPIEKLTTSFGQGSTMTPIQQVKAMTALTNKGEMLQPYIIKQIVDSQTGEVLQSNKRTVVSNPVSEEAAEKVLSLMSDVVNSEIGTGRIYQLDDYTVAGKTGTAEVPNPEGPGYLTGKENNIYSFLGVAPAEDPELIMYVAVTKPKLGDNEYGHYPVAEIFTNVMGNSLRYLNIAPDIEPDTLYDTVEVPDVLGKNTEIIAKTLREKGLNVTIVGDGKIVSQTNVNSGETVFTNDHIYLITDKPKMPNIEGWSLREVLQFGHLLKLKTETVGEGYVIRQSVEVGTPLKEGDYLGVELKPPEVPKDEEIEGDIENEETEEEEDS